MPCAPALSTSTSAERISADHGLHSRPLASANAAGPPAGRGGCRRPQACPRPSASRPPEYRARQDGGLQKHGESLGERAGQAVAHQQQVAAKQLAEALFAEGGQRRAGTPLPRALLNGKPSAAALSYPVRLHERLHAPLGGKRARGGSLPPVAAALGHRLAFAQNWNTATVLTGSSSHYTTPLLTGCCSLASTAR
eukprot:scaffold71012_cov64-Phaeocystis_antarctica.AAC.4